MLKISFADQLIAQPPYSALYEITKDGYLSFKLDLTLLEAAADLGCKPFKAFLTITLPLSRPGILAGFMLVFIPALGEFVFRISSAGPIP